MVAAGDRWGCRLYGYDVGLHWIERSDRTKALRCDECNTYEEDFVLDYRPSARDAENFLDALRTRSLLSTIDGFTVFDSCGRSSSTKVCPEVFTFEFASGGFGLDLSSLPAVSVMSADYSRSRQCGSCGRVSRVWQTRQHAADVIKVQQHPHVALCRSREWFNLAYNRRPDVYVHESVAIALGLDTNADFPVLIADEVPLTE